MSNHPGVMRLQVGTANAASSIDAYLEYKRIVGDDDGGTPFTDDQYDAYIKRVTPMRTKNRLYVSWTSPSGMDCKLIGPETLCFCNHRYRQHKTDFERVPSTRPLPQPCRERGCPCSSYTYLPLNGSQPVRCSCKHMPEDHDVRSPNVCKHPGCRACSGYRSSFTCGCGEPAYKHELVVETKEERAARGHPVGRDTLYQAMGGITGFSSLADGYARMDPSGRGGLPPGSNLPITASDHPFLRSNVESIRSHRQETGANNVDGDLAERMSAMRRPGESEMDYYERRYQERLKQEKTSRRPAPIKQKQTVVVGERQFSNALPASQTHRNQARGAIQERSDSSGSEEERGARGGGRNSHEYNYLESKPKPKRDPRK